MIEYELGMERDGKDDIIRRVECFSDEDAAKMFTDLMIDMTGYGGLKYVLELDNEVLVFDPDDITMISWRKLPKYAPSSTSFHSMTWAGY